MTAHRRCRVCLWSPDRAALTFFCALAFAAGCSEESQPRAIPCETSITVGPAYSLAQEAFTDENLRTQAYFDLVRAGGKLWLGYSSQNQIGTGRVYLRTIGCDGTLGAPISFEDPDDQALLPALATNDDVVAMTWTAGALQYRLSSWDAVTGEQLADNVATLNLRGSDRFRFGFVTALSDGNFVVSGADEDGDATHGLLQLVSPTGELIGDSVTASTASFAGPRLAALDDGSLLAAWEDPETGAPSMERYTSNLSMDPREIFGASTEYVGWGSWASDGEVAIYAYSESGQDYGVTKMREVTSGAQVTLSDSGLVPDVAFGDEGGAVIYIRRNPTTTYREVVVRLFSFENEVFTLLPERVIEEAPKPIMTKIAYVGKGVYFAAWTAAGEIPNDSILRGQALLLQGDRAP